MGGSDDECDDESSYCPSEAPSMDSEVSLEPEDDLAGLVEHEDHEDEEDLENDDDEWIPVPFSGEITLHYEIIWNSNGRHSCSREQTRRSRLQGMCTMW